MTRAQTTENLTFLERAGHWVKLADLFEASNIALYNLDYTLDVRVIESGHWVGNCRVFDCAQCDSGVNQ